MKKKTFIMLLLFLTGCIISLLFTRYQFFYTQCSFKNISYFDKSPMLIVENLPSSLYYNQADYEEIYDSVEADKTAWATMINNHLYNNRTIFTSEEWIEIPKTDRPDLAAEYDFLMTMDPSTGEVPSERKMIANKKIDSIIKNKAAIAGISWQERGPDNVGGRARALMFDPNDVSNKKVWVAGVAGGLWYTNDITVAEPVWVNVDDFWNNIAISCIAYNPANTQEFFVGTGEGWYNSDALRGGGIWKSADGGVTWNQLANTDPGAYNSSSDFHYVNKIVVKNNGTILAATRGYYINRGGVMRSTDGGVNWTKVLTVYTGAGTLYDRAADIEIAANGDLYASFGIFSDGKVFKSLNASDGAAGTWADLSAAVGIGNAKRIELACAPSNSNIIYAVAQGGSGDTDVEWFKKSIDAGTSWNPVTTPLMVDGSGDHFTRSQAFYNLILAVHPSNPNCVIAGGIDLHRSLDGGTNWTGISHWYGGFGKPEVHADQHAIQFRPGASNELIFGNDGGVYFSTNAGDVAATPSFSSKNIGFNVTQFYSCAIRNEINSHYFLAGSQDNGSQQFTIPQIGDTYEVTGGDGGACHIDQLNPAIQLTSYTYNSIYRSLDTGSSFTLIVNEGSGYFINPSDYDSQRKILYASSNADFIKRVSGIDAAITNTNIAISIGASKISALKVSPYNDVVFLGIANGRVYKFANASTGSPVLTRIDNGTTPITTAGWVSSVDVGANDNQLIVSYSNYGVISLWETTDGGVNWYSKEGNLPDIPVRSVIYNPDDRNQVLAATELGVWSTDNFQPGTANPPVWGPSNTGLAHTRCDMLEYRSADKMVALASHGRGLFTTDAFVTTSVADFTANSTVSCTGSLTVNFTDGSLKPNGSWEWDIDNNSTVDYTTQNCTHTYNTPGLYSVKLTIDGGATSETKLNYIMVSNSEPTVCSGCALSDNSNLANGFGIGLYNFSVGGISNRTSYNDGYYNNYTCTKWSALQLNTEYDITIRTGTVNNEGARVYIDYNDNGVFEAGESVASFAANKDGTRTMAFTTPASGVVMDKGLRLRVLTRFSSTPANACDISTYGQAEDYTVIFPSAIPMPIELISFTAECNDAIVNLEWITASESDIDYYVVTRSVNCVDFEDIGLVAAAGNSNQINHYLFADNSPLFGTTYYRLIQTDINGNSEFSSIYMSDCENDAQINVFPNPSSGFYTVTGMSTETKLTVYNSLGNEVWSSVVENSEQFIDLSYLPNGLYYMVFKTGESICRKNLIIRK